MRALRILCVGLVAGGALGLACGRDLDLPPEPLPPIVVGAGGCITDDDCEEGICSADHVCDPTRCHEDDQCESGRCRSSGTCAVRSCDSDVECPLDNYCNELTEGDSACVVGCRDDLNCSEGKSCKLVEGQETSTCTAGCSFDSECPPCAACIRDGGVYGTCSSGPVHPPLAGDPTALTMRDNLEAAVSFVRARDPDAQLIQINGSGLATDGTVDITQPGDFTSRWMYGFQIGDGSSSPIRFATVTYLLQGGPDCGFYDGNAGNISAKPSIPDAVWTQYLDSPQLVAAFLAESGCAAPTRQPGDYILYDHDGTPPQFILGNWKSQFVMGDPTTGELRYVSCP